MITITERIKCDTCGRFFADGTGDSGTTFGNYLSDEPPEPEDFCSACADNCFFNALIERKLSDCWWIKPEWHREAQVVLGHHRQP